MSVTSDTKTKRNWILLILVIISLAITAYLLTQVCVHDEPQFEPPAIAENYTQGKPFFPEQNSYSRVYQEGMQFSAHIMAEPYIKDNQLVVYFTNDEINDVLMKLVVTDIHGTQYAETGTIEPDSYIQAIDLLQVPQTGTELHMKIIAYEKDTYYSAGTVILKTVLE